MPIPLSIRLRLTLWYVLVLAAVLAAFGAGVFLVLRQALYNNLDESIQNQGNALLGAIRYEGGSPSLVADAISGNSADAEQFVRVFDASAELTFDSSGIVGDVPVAPEVVDSGLRGETSMRRVKIKEDDDLLRVLVLPIRLDGRVVGVLEVGQFEEDVSDTLTTLLLTMGVAYPVALVVAILGGVFLAGRALSPVDKITTLARRISAERLGQRLNLRLPDDEVGRLAQTFDEMIGRLDDAFRHQRQFTSDASHEPRTPLTIMKGPIDVALQKQRGPKEYRQVLQAVNDEVDRLIHLAGSLLTLTRADAGQIPLALERVSVADVIADAEGHLHSQALQKGVELQLVSSNGVTVHADEDLLLQLLLNLLDNAIKYTPSGGQVTIGWTGRESHVELWVRDSGIGISQEHIPHLFDRFYRVDQGRSRSEGGVGLGLAISRWIAEAHGGSIRVESVPGEGSTFTVLIPMSR